MVRPRTVLSAALIWIAPLVVGALAGPASAGQSYCEVYGAAPTPESSVPDGSTSVYFPYGPICDEPSKVGPATEAWIAQDDEEIERLGCAVVELDGLWLRVIRCDPGAMAYSERYHPRWTYAQPPRRDPTLPRSVCEVEWTSSDGRSVNFYARHSWIIPLK